MAAHRSRNTCATLLQICGQSFAIATGCSLREMCDLTKGQVLAVTRRRIVAGPGQPPGRDLAAGGPCCAFRRHGASARAARQGAPGGTTVTSPPTTEILAERWCVSSLDKACFAGNLTRYPPKNVIFSPYLAIASPESPDRSVCVAAQNTTTLRRAWPARVSAMAALISSSDQRPDTISSSFSRPCRYSSAIQGMSWAMMASPIRVPIMP